MTLKVMKCSRFYKSLNQLATKARFGRIWLASYAVLVLLDLNDIAVLEGPPHNVGLLTSALDMLGLGDGRPELVEFLELDEVPHKRERGLDNSTLDDLADEAEGLAGHGWMEACFVDGFFFLVQLVPCVDFRDDVTLALKFRDGVCKLEV